MHAMRIWWLLGMIGCSGSSPCDDGTWAGWQTPYGVVWVSPTGDDSASGRAGRPLRTVQAAMEDIKRSRRGRIGLLPGVFDGGAQVIRDDKRSVTISGCSAEEVVIRGNTGKPSTPTLALQGGGEFVVQRLGIEGGSGGITITGGGQASLESIVVSEAEAQGIIIGGEDTVAVLTDVTVKGTKTGIGGRPAGWGLGIVGAQVTLSRVELIDNRGFGLNMDGGTLDAQQLVVEQTSSTSPDRFGTGIYAKHAKRVSLSECAVRDSDGDGIFLIDNKDVTVRDCVVDGTMSSRSHAGDGLVVRQVGTAGAPPPVTLSGNIVTNAARLGIVVAGPLTAALTGNQADDSNGVSINGHSRFATESASVTGDNAHAFELDEYRVGRLYRPW